MDLNDELELEEGAEEAPKARRMSFQLPKALRRPIRLGALFRNTGVIAQREIGATFHNPMSYGIVALFLVSCGLYLFVVHDFFGVNEATVRPLMRQLPLFLAALIPVMTMRLLADERRLGTLEWLQTLPVTNTQMVLGKFLASMFMLFGILLTTGIFPVIVAQVGSLDTGQILAGYIGLFFVGCAYCGIGILASALTRNQLVALVLALVLSLLFYGLSTLLGIVSPEAADLVSYASFKEHFATMERGVIDNRNLVFYLSVLVVALTGATQALARGRRSSSKGAVISLVIALVVAVGMNVTAGLNVARIDLSKAGVNTLARASTDIVGKFSGLYVKVYLSPDLPKEMSAPTTGKRIDTRIIRQRFFDLLKEYQANALGRMAVNVVSTNLDKKGPQAGMVPFSDRGRDRQYYFGATFTMGDVVERLPSAMDPDFHEYEVTRLLIRLRERVLGFKTLKTVRHAVKTISKAARRCQRHLTQAITPFDQLPAQKQREPVLSRLRFAEYKRNIGNIKDRCHWLSELNAAMSVHEGQHRILDAMRTSTAAAAEMLRQLVKALVGRDASEARALALVGRLRNELKKVTNAANDFEASPGRKSIGLVCTGTSFCPFRPPPRFSEEDRRFIEDLEGEPRALGQEFFGLTERVGGELERMRQEFFRGAGFDVVPVDLNQPLPAGLGALAVIGSAGPAEALSVSKTHVLQDFSEAHLYSLDQFLLSGGSLAVFLNPWHVELVAKKEDGTTHSSITKNASSIGKLLAGYGVIPDGNLVIESRQHDRIRMEVSVSSQGATAELHEIGYPLVPRLTALAAQSPLRRSLRFVTLPFTTSFTVKHPAAQPLALSSRKSISRPGNELPLEPKALWDWAQKWSHAVHKATPIVVSVEGTFTSYFASSPEGTASNRAGAHRVKGRGRLLASGSNLGLEPLHYDTIIDPGLDLMTIGHKMDAFRAELRSATLRFENWKASLDRLRPELGPRHTSTRIFLRNALDWLTENEKLRNISAKLIPTSRLDINPHKDHGWPARIRAFAIASGPSLLLLLGLLVWLTRRRRRKWITRTMGGSAPQGEGVTEPKAEPQEPDPKTEATPPEPATTTVDDTDPSMAIPDFGPMNGIDETPEADADNESKT